MANLTGRFDPNAEAQQDFSAIPAGEYLARIMDSDIKPTKNNTGEYVELVYEIIEGEYKNRRLWARITLSNPNPKAVEVGNRQFASVREATGVPNPRDTMDLHNKPHIVRVEFIPAGTVQGSYTTTKDSNEIKAWKRLDNGAAASGNAPTGASPQPSAAATPASPSSPPWARNAA